MADSFGEDGKFFWFLGVVEDVNDPLQLGRIKFRHLTDHNPSSTEYVETDDMPWCTPMTPVGSASRYGVGSAPVGVNPGSYVFGFYIDGAKRTKPMIMGTWPVYHEESANHSVSKLARGIGPVEKEYLDVEPKTQYAAEYPWNKTITTLRGHTIEIDDTPEAERIHVFHRSGSYVEMNPDGSVVVKTNGNNFDIVDGDQTIHIEGDQDITIKGDQTVLIEGDQDVTIKGDQTVLIEGDQDVTIKGDQTLSVDGDQDVTIKGKQSITVDGNVSYKVNGTTTIDCSSVTITGDLTVEGIIKGKEIKTNKGVDLNTHKHTGVTTGSGVSGPPK